MADIDEISRRPNEYLAETGVPQLLGGAIFCFFGGGVLIQHVLPKGFLDEDILGWISLCCAGVALLGAWALKRRIVFPRGGYVELRPRPAVKVALVAFVAALAVIAISAMAWPGWPPHMERRLTQPGLAIFGGILCLASGRQQKSKSAMWFGVYLVGLAPLLWLPERGIERQAWLEVGIGAPFAVAGAFRLRNFLKANPRPVETTNE